MKLRPVRLLRKSTLEKEEIKSKEEVLKAAKAALQDENSTEEVCIDKNDR